MPGFHHSVAVLPLLFRRCKILSFCKNYARKLRSVTAVNSKKICNGSGNGVRKWQNGMMETGHKVSEADSHHYYILLTVKHSIRLWHCNSN